MKIEFRKIPSNPKDFSTSFDSVILEGTFCKMSSRLVKVDASLVGITHIQCCRCGNEEPRTLNEKLDFLLSDGVFTDAKSDDLVVEVENSTIDFDEIVESELSSFKSDYNICQECSKTNSNFEKEF